MQNGEEKHTQALYQEKRKEDCATIRLLRQEVANCQNTIREVEINTDYQADKLNLINGAIELYNTGERSEGITLDTIRGIME